MKDGQCYSMWMEGNSYIPLMYLITTVTNTLVCTIWRGHLNKFDTCKTLKEISSYIWGRQGHVSGADTQV